MPSLPFLRWELLRWVILGAAVVVLAAFLFAQQQSTDISYGLPSSEERDLSESNVDADPVTLPSVLRMNAMLAAEPVVRLPGSIARWDEQQVEEMIGEHDVRILVAPPALDRDQNDRLRDVENATIRVVGTQVTGGIYEAVAGSLPGWRDEFGARDVTGQLLLLIAELTDQPHPPDEDLWRWREPSATELSIVADHLRATGLHTAPDARLTSVPDEAAAAAFPDDRVLFVALPDQPPGEPVPNYGPALVAEFPQTPIVLLYGSWIEYHGPHQDEFAYLASASFYAQFGSVLRKSDYPLENILAAFLHRIADIRHAGLFDRPLPYQPFDPLRVALPLLPWLFTACAVGFLLLSLRGIAGRGSRSGGVRAPGSSAQLAGLSALAVEMSLLTDRRSDPALTRGIGKLQAARAALADELPDRHVRSLVEQARSELDSAARTMGLAFLRPHNYLRGWLS